MADHFGEDSQWWIAGYEDESGTFHNLEKDSRAVVPHGEEVYVYWDRWEKFYETHDYADEFVESNKVTLGWIADNGETWYATLMGGVDLDYFDFETWVAQYE